MIDKIITKDDIVPYRNNERYWGYFSSIVVHPDYRQRGIASLLLQSWTSLIVHLANDRNIYFNKIVADAVSEDGVRLLSKIGFSFSKSSSHDSKIMTVDFFSHEVSRTKYNSEILDVYEKLKQ